MIPEGLVPQPIERSWKRCLSMGVAVEDKHHDFDGLSAGDLSSARERSSILLTHAEPIMENLREQIANTRSMVILTDPSGLILKSTGDEDFMSRRAGSRCARVSVGTSTTNVRTR